MKYFTPALLILLQTFAGGARASYDDPTCDNVCSQLVDTTNDQVVGITGSDSWTSSDDAWCAANPYSSSNPPTTTALATQDNRCQYHNTQVLTYCIAYEKNQAATGMEMPLLVLDVAGAALCGTACAGSLTGAGEAVFAACRIDSTGASAMEIYDALVLDSDATSRALTGVMGAAGIGINLIGAADASKNGNANMTEFFTGKGGNNDKRNACITAGILAAGAGMRAWDITHQQQSKQSACNDVKGLLSGSPVIGAVTPTSTTSSVAQTGNSTGSGATLGIARTSSVITGSGAGNLAAQVACAQNGITSCNYSNAGQMSAATDGGLLSSSGLDKVAAQQLANTDLSGVSSTAPNAGSMISSAMGNSGDIATKIADVARAAQNDGQTLAKASGGYSGGGAVAQAPKAPGFGGFNFDSGTAAEKKDEVGFNRAPASTDGDIWHANYKGSIFQLVSSKIVESKPRVDTLDWSTPLNRALMGLPSKSASQGAGGLK